MQLVERLRKMMKQAKNGRVSTPPKVLIVGAGFAGLYAARTFRHQPVEVTIVDRNNYHRFQPLLYQVATSGLEPHDIAQNVRDIFSRYDNISFQLGTVKAVDLDGKRVRMRNGLELGYDYLILATGAVTKYFGIEGVREHSYPLKNLPDAVALRNHVLRQFERASRAPGAAEDGVLNFVVVGGGPTGVEMAGALTELFRVLQKDYPEFDTDRAKVYLIEMLPELLPSYDPEQGRYARRVLERRGVEVMTETTVERATSDTVYLKSGRELPSQSLIWAAGVKASPVADSLDTELVQGRVRVRSDLSLPHHPEVFVAGDLAACEHDGEPAHPQLAPVAIQQGRHAARQVLRRMKDKDGEPFEYVELGKMATIGRNAAVAEFAGGLKLRGFVAWLAWVFVHIARLVGMRNRLSVFLNWIHNYFTYDRSARLILDLIPISDENPYEAEEITERIRRAMIEAEREAAE